MRSKSSADVAHQNQLNRVDPPQEVTLPDGIYLVERWTENEYDLGELLPGETKIVHYPGRISGEEKGSAIFLTVSVSKAVLFDQLRSLDQLPQGDGRINLNLTISKESAGMLETLTRKYLGRQVSVVVGGDAITLHKIRGIIRDGKLQISRCTDDGCKVILKELQKSGLNSVGADN